MTNLRDIFARIHVTALSKGFWTEPVWMDKYVAKIGLIHSECTEVLEALRKNKGGEAVTEECADILIRTIDLHTKLLEDGYAEGDLWEILVQKVEANDRRPALHGHKWG